ncbi:hypothetical protein DSECCO2_458730 [anaerobic digester metagenome]
MTEDQGDVAVHQPQTREDNVPGHQEGDAGHQAGDQDENRKLLLLVAGDGIGGRQAQQQGEENTDHRNNQGVFHVLQKILLDEHPVIVLHHRLEDELRRPADDIHLGLE